MPTLEQLTTEIAAEVKAASNLVADRQIESEADVAAVTAARLRLLDLKERTEDARDALYLPLVAEAKDVQARFAPHLATLKKADDVLRHRIRHWHKLKRKGAHA